MNAMRIRIARNILAALSLLASFNLQLSTLSAQGTAFTYQGRVTSHGTNFSGKGQFKFALVTVTNIAATATATANVTAQFVTSVDVTFGGNGYTSPPSVSFSGGGGSGATAHAVVGGGVVTSVVVDNTGSGYSNSPTVTIAAPPDTLAFTTLWSNDGTSLNGSEPTSAVEVAVDSGLFTVRLGDATLGNMSGFPAGLFRQPDLQLRIWFNNGLSGFSALSPTQPLAAAPYAVSALELNGTLAASQLTGAISSNQISNGSITAAMLASGAVTASKLDSTIGVWEHSGNNVYRLSGNVGVGTTAPTVRVHVDEGADASPTSGGYIVAGNIAGQNVAIDENEVMARNNGAASTLFLNNNGGVVYSGAPVGIGTITPANLLHARGNAPAMLLQDTASAANQAGYLGFWNNVSAETAWVGFGTPGSTEFTVLNTRGDIVLWPADDVGIGRTPAANKLEVEGNASKSAAGSWLANSDARIKTDVQTITGALDKLAQVRLVQFRYTKEYRAQHPALEDRSYLNVVAQEFQKVFPDHVQSSGENLPCGGDPILQVDTYPLTIYAAAAIQELNGKLTEELKHRDAENTELKQRLENLERLVIEKNGGAK